MPPLLHLAVALPSGQGLTQVGELALAFVLSSLIGLEREWRQKSAGLRTLTLVGTGAALLLIVSKYGFSDVVGPRVTLDPSRVAAQIVTGIGFIGGGLIFVKGDAVRGLTTAAVVWMTAAIGMACAGGLVILALAATAAHFVVAFVYPRLVCALPRSRYMGAGVRVVYEDGQGVLRDILGHSTEMGFSITQVQTQKLQRAIDGQAAVAVTLEVQGQPLPEQLVLDLNDLEGVVEVSTVEAGRGAD